MYYIYDTDIKIWHYYFYKSNKVDCPEKNSCLEVLQWYQEIYKNVYRKMQCIGLSPSSCKPDTDEKLLSHYLAKDPLIHMQPL